MEVDIDRETKIYRNSTSEIITPSIQDFCKAVGQYEWQCLLCLPKILNIKFDKTSVSNFARHVKNKHPSHHQRYLELRRQEKPDGKIKKNNRRPSKSIQGNQYKSVQNQQNCCKSKNVNIDYISGGINDGSSDYSATLKDLNETPYTESKATSHNVYSYQMQNINNIRDEEEAFGLLIARKLTHVPSQLRKMAIQTKILMILNEEIKNTR